MLVFPAPAQLAGLVRRSREALISNEHGEAETMGCSPARWEPRHARARGRGAKTTLPADTLHRGGGLSAATTLVLLRPRSRAASNHSPRSSTAVRPRVPDHLRMTIGTTHGRLLVPPRMITRNKEETRDRQRQKGRRQKQRRRRASMRTHVASRGGPRMGSQHYVVGAALSLSQTRTIQGPQCRRATR